jgi:ribosome-binding factor A
LSHARGGPGRTGAQRHAPWQRERAPGPSQRQLRVAELIRHLLAEALMRGQVHDPQLRDASVTVGEVRVSRDLREAHVFVTELGRGLRPETQAALERAGPWLAGRLARQMSLKYAPRLRFVADAMFDEAARMERLLDEEMARVRPAASESEDGEGQA